MQLSLRPYVTAGLAIAGASVIAVAPIQPVPTDVQIPNPAAEVARDVQLAGFIDETVNSLVFTFVATPVVRGTEIFLVPIAEAILPEELAPLAASLPLVSLGLAGPLISGPGAIGTALQGIVDGYGVDFGTGLLAAINAPAIIIDGYVNGGYGPNLFPLVGDLLPLPPFVPIIPTGPTTPPTGCATPPVASPSCIAPTYTVLAGGLINQASVDTILGFIPPNPLSPLLPSSIGVTTTLPGTYPTLTRLVGTLLEVVDIGGFLSPESATVPEANVTTFKTTNEEKLVTLDVAPNQGEEARGKHAAPDTTFAAPQRELPDLAGDTAKQVAEALKLPKTRGSGFGEAVKTAAKPDSAPGGGPIVRKSLSFVPETGKKNGGVSGDSNPAITKISSAAKGFGDAVKKAVGLGGGDEK